MARLSDAEASRRIARQVASDLLHLDERELEDMLVKALPEIAERLRAAVPQLDEARSRAWCATFAAEVAAQVEQLQALRDGPYDGNA